MKPRQISPGVFSVGAVDWDRRLFDSLIPLPEGTSYNSYLLRGKEKTALLDAVDPAKIDVLERALAGLPKLDFLVSHHTEQDHSGGIPWVLAKYPEARLLCSRTAKGLLIDHLMIDPERIQTVSDGERLSLGGMTLRFIETPWVHWPETMSTYLEEEGLLFSCDWFGSHLATSELFVRNEAEVYNGAKRYYAEIMMPFRKAIQGNMEKIKTLDIRMIAPSHGPVYRRPDFILEAYRDWISDQPKNVIVLPWVSMHGSTQKMVEFLAEALVERGLAVEPLNLAATDPGRLAMALVDAASIIVGCPTVLTGPHPLAADAVILANALRPKARFASLVGSYGWGGRMLEVIKGLVPNLKVEFLDPVIAKGHPRDPEFRALEALADKVLEKHRSLGLL